MQKVRLSRRRLRALPRLLVPERPRVYGQVCQGVASSPARDDGAAHNGSQMFTQGLLESLSGASGP